MPLFRSVVNSTALLPIYNTLFWEYDPLQNFSLIVEAGISSLNLAVSKLRKPFLLKVESFALNLFVLYWLKK